MREKDKFCQTSLTKEETYPDISCHLQTAQNLQDKYIDKHRWYLYKSRVDKCFHPLCTRQCLKQGK